MTYPKMLDHPQHGQHRAMNAEEEKELTAKGYQARTGPDPDGERLQEYFGAMEEPEAGDETTEVIDLSAMTKPQLIEHAAEVHNLELHPSLNKAEMIGSIEAAQGPQ